MSECIYGITQKYETYREMKKRSDFTGKLLYGNKMYSLLISAKNGVVIVSYKGKAWNLWYIY